ncbi:unnamed protein product [Gordionus sp. m RMFG-2023]|uniref:proteasome subunit alpha type-3-like n=1 Tax=Gordionus sp. m RMFG-2023 TaxID=3053472 RepID=UPI0030DFEECA
MSSIGTGYDLSASQFSPDGRIFQVEYALKAVENSSTAIGIRVKDGIILGVEKPLLSKLYEDSSNSRLFNIDIHIGMVVAGLLADANMIVEVARDEALNHRRKLGSAIPLKYLVKRLSMYFHAYTLYSAVRPFACSVILGSSTDESGPELYMIEPSGVSLGYFSCAIGKAKQAAKTEFEKLKNKDLLMKDSVKELSKILMTIHDEAKDKDNFILEMGWAGKETKGLHHTVPEDIYHNALTYAKESLRDTDDEEEMA